MLDNIILYLGDESTLVFKWQILVGALIGASAPFLLWWLSQKHIQRRKHIKNLLYLNRAIADQIYVLIDTRNTIIQFIEGKLLKLINEPRVESKLGDAYSVDLAFFPLFSARALSQDFLMKSTGSSYLDNKLARAYSISQDLPFVMEDLKRQFQETLDFNKDISFKRLNPPNVQLENYLKHLQKYKETVEDDMLLVNIPVFLKTLTEALVAIEKLRDIGLRRWRFKFDARYKLKFYSQMSDYHAYRRGTFERIEKYFEVEVKKKVEEFSILKDSEVQQ